MSYELAGIALIIVGLLLIPLVICTSPEWRGKR